MGGQNAVHLTRTVLVGTVGSADARVLVAVVSGAEVLVSGLLLIWGRQRLRRNIGASFSPVTGFTVGLTTQLGGESNASCGCFGAFGLGLSLETTLLRNLVVWLSCWLASF